MSDLTMAIVVIIIVVALCSALSVAVGEQPKCTVQELEKSSLVVCTYKNKVLFNGEIDE